MNILIQALDNKGDKMSDGNIPPPNEVKFFIEWWQEILSGVIVIATGWLLKSKGQQESVEPVYLIADDIEKLNIDIEQRMKICRQSIFLELNEMLDRRDEKLIERIKEIIE